MAMNSIARLWARTALVWFLGAIGFGMYIGLSGQFGLASPHAHLGLLGWVSSMLFAFLYSATGEPAPRGARIHWIVHNLGVVGLATGMFMIVKTGDQSWGEFIGLSGSLVVLATLWLVAMMWPRLSGR